MESLGDTHQAVRLAGQELASAYVTIRHDEALQRY
jgi:hypothetical protein